MKPLTSDVVYNLAQLTEYLRLVKNYDAVIYDDGSYEKYGQKLILSSINDLVSQLQMYELASQDCIVLSGLYKEFQKKYVREKVNIDDLDHRKLTLIVERIEASIKQEIRRRNFAELTPVEGMLNYNRLLREGVQSLLGDITWKLDKIVSHDLDEAIKCLSYGAPTASVMIGLRAVEGMLKQVHTHLTGDQSKKMWKQLLDGIKEDLKGKGIEETPLFGYLEYVREMRNQVDHPDRSFTQLEAEGLFMHAIDIVKEVEKLGGAALTKK